MPEITLSSNERTVYDLIVNREDYGHREWVAKAAVLTLRAMNLSNALTLIKEGTEAITLDTSFDQVAKIRRLDTHQYRKSPMTLEPVQQFDIGTGFRLLIAPKLTTKGETKFHQQILMYELWRRGLDFWDTAPPLSDLTIIKNIRLVPEGYSHAGIPFVIDEGAVNIDKANHYEVENGLRTQHAYKARNYEELWPDDAASPRLSEELLNRVLSHSFCWPEDQWTIFPREIKNDGKDIHWNTIKAVDRKSVV